MNRLDAEAAPPQLVAATPPRPNRPIPKTFARSAAGQTFFAPHHYEPNYAYPLLVWLHSRGGDERQLLKVMPHISMRNYVAVGVRGVQACEGRGFDWEPSPTAIAIAESRVLEAIATACGKFHLNTSRIFIGGCETGGTMAFRLALRNPRKFAGALSLGGAFPTGQTPLVHLHALRDLPLFLGYSRDSEVYSTDDLCEELPLFHTASLKLAIRQYPCGDELTTQMLADMDAWMMEQVTGIPAADEAAAMSRPCQWN